MAYSRLDLTGSKLRDHRSNQLKFKKQVYIKVLLGEKWLDLVSYGAAIFVDDLNDDLHMIVLDVIQVFRTIMMVLPTEIEN